MKSNYFLLIGSITGLVIGWSLGYLQLPYVEQSQYLWISFAAGLAISSLIFLFWNVWKQEKLAGIKIGEKERNLDFMKNKGDNTPTWILIISIIVLAGILIGFLLVKENQDLRENSWKQQNIILKLSEKIESSRNSNLVPLMANLLQEVKEELKNQPDQLLKKATISRIAALSHSFKPYKYWEGDRLSLQSYSPERAQLLVALINMGIHVDALDQILQKTSFEAADLGGLDLSELDLNNINLQGANLKEVNFSHTKLRRANLSESNLWGAKFNHADLTDSNLKKANISWAEANQAILMQANLEKAILSNAKLKGSNLQSTSLKWVDADGTIFQEADLTGANLTGAGLNKANLSKSKLTDAILTLAKIEESDFREAKLDRLIVFEKNWIEKLDASRVLGKESIKANYQIVEDPPAKFTIRIKE